MRELLGTVSAVRETMIKRLEAELDPEARREMQMALEELDFMWQELQGEAAALVRENARYAEFFHYAPDACLITDGDGAVREANQAALELFRGSPEEIVGRSLGEYIAAAATVLGARAKPASLSARLQPAAGPALEVELSVRVITIKQSGASGLCWLVRPSSSRC